jgi:hypothetical protein
MRQALATFLRATAVMQYRNPLGLYSLNHLLFHRIQHHALSSFSALM